MPVNHPPFDVSIDNRRDRYVLSEVEGDRNGQGVVLWFEANKARSTRAKLVAWITGKVSAAPLAALRTTGVIPAE